MTAPAEPEQRYIITESRLKRFENGGYFDVLLEEIRKTPVVSEKFECCRIHGKADCRYMYWESMDGKTMCSRQHPYPPKMASDKERIVHGCHRPDKENDCELDNIKCIDCEHWEPRYPEEDTSAQQRIADAIKELEDRAKSEDNTASICRGEARYEHRAYASKYREAIALLREESKC